MMSAESDGKCQAARKNGSRGPFIGMLRQPLVVLFQVTCVDKYSQLLIRSDPKGESLLVAWMILRARSLIALC
eukprot:scaffold11337_cov104-Skeletonema_marinoi.AAC.2